MMLDGLFEILAFSAGLLAFARPLGWYMTRVYAGDRIPLTGVFRALERIVYRVAGIQSDKEYDWQWNARALLYMNGAGILVLYGLQRVQHVLPLNPLSLGPVPADLALNTAISFVSNTNWQAYSGETTVSSLTQMLGLTVQNFLSAATGMAIAVQFFRGLARRTSPAIGNLWVDMVRSIVYILLPLSILLSIVLVSEGVVQTFGGPVTIELLEPTSDRSGTRVTEQVLPLGPVASQVAIKQLGTNGGGFYNVNAAHPLENPTPLTNFLEMMSILLIPAALCFTFGAIVGDRRQGHALLAAMAILFAVCCGVAVTSEQGGNPAFPVPGVGQAAGPLQGGGNMEGKEVRFGPVSSALWAAATTAASNGSVNAMHDSFTPFGGLALLVLMQLGEVAFGGVGSGITGMLVCVVATVFVAGLLVGRTPEYLGKKIESFEIRMVSLLLLLMPGTVLVATAIAVVTPAGTSSIFNPGAHGFSEVLYAFTSLANNNGSAFAGLAANTPFYNILGGLVMLVGRYWIALATLALAGSLARKERVAGGSGRLPTHSPVFVALLLAIIVMVGALNFVPALALGPVAEHFQMMR